MFTVLILTKQARASWREHQAIFGEFHDSIAMCPWNEGGDTIQTALPELKNIINSKLSWNAIIVTTEPENTEKNNQGIHVVDPVNPFDYLENSDRHGEKLLRLDEDGNILETDIPLIKLCHLLGGMPAPEAKQIELLYEYRSDDDSDEVEDKKAADESENNTLDAADKTDSETTEGNISNSTASIDKLKRPKFKFVMDKKQLTAHSKWEEEHPFVGVRPSSIIMVKVRKALSAKDEFEYTKDQWRNHNESESSMFWKRNLYPQNCRFVVYDLSQKGLIERSAEMFKLWTSILLISNNEIDSNVLQAHRLYKLGITFDNEMLSDSFQKTVNKLNSAKHVLEASLSRSEERTEESATGCPSYDLSIPVVFSDEEKKRVKKKPKIDIRLVKRDSDDIEWEVYTDSSLKEYHDRIANIDRELDNASNWLREKCEYSDKEVTELTNYQTEEMVQSLEQKFIQIVQQQQRLPSKLSSLDDELAKANKEVKKQIVKRISIDRFDSVLYLSTMLVVVSIISGIALCEISFAGMIIVLSAALLIVAVALITVHKQKKRLLDSVRKYNHVLSEANSALSANANLYSTFLGLIASHIHGCSYIEISRGKNDAKSNTYSKAKRRINGIENFLDKIKAWSVALRVSPAINTDYDDVSYMDIDSSNQDYSSIYSFDAGRYFSIPLNSGGYRIDSPYSFVKKVTLKREELYDLTAPGENENGNK